MNGKPPASPLQLAPPRRVTVVESIIEQVVASLQDGHLKPGDRLPSERDLMAMLSVSRSSVREALQGLAAMNLVVGRPGEGTFVKALQPRLEFAPDIASLSSSLQKAMRHHLNEARLVLELDIVALAAERITEADRQAILGALQEYEAHKHLATEELGWPAHDGMHLAIAEATGNPILVRVLQHLMDMVPRPLRDKGMQFGEPEDVLQRLETERDIHQHLCEAVAQQDAAAAVEWMKRHAEHEEQIINEYYA